MYSVMGDWTLLQPGFPIRTSPDQSLLTAPRGNFAVRRVLLQLLAPRHPPCALISLTLLQIIVLTPILTQDLPRLETDSTLFENYVHTNILRNS